MNLYRFIISPTSPWSSVPSSDTLYGLVCYRLAEFEGEGACEKIIASFHENRPVFELSSLMPQNCLPMPSLPSPGRAFFQKLAREKSGRNGEEQALFEILQKYKKFKKARWLPLKSWLRNKQNLSATRLFESLDSETKEEKEDFSKSAYEPHVGIDRQTGSARDGQLFFTRLQYFDRKSKFHLYARAQDPAWLYKYLKLIGEMGFGQNASSGHGQFEVQEDGDFKPETLEQEGANASLLLSSCIAPDMKTLRGFYRLEIKRGKTGPGYANPFKNPFLMLQEGSLLTAPLHGPYVLRDINEDRRVVQIMQPLTLPCVFQQEETE